MSSSNGNGNGNGNSGNGFMSGIGGRLWGGDKDSSSATATTTSAAAAPAPPRRTQRERVDRSNNNNSAPVAAAAPPPPPPSSSSAGGSRRMHSTTSSTQPADDTASPSSTTPRAARVRPPSTYAAGGDVSALQSQSLNQQQQQQQSPRRERERPDRDFSLSADRMPDSSLAQSNKERDIARRHQFRQEQLRALREREEQEALMPSPPPTTTLVNVVDAPINVVVIPGYGNDDDYVLDYLSASSGDESEYHSDKKEKRPQRHTKFSPNHRSLPTTSAVARPGGSKRKNAGNRVSFDISKQPPGLKPTTRIPSNTGRERIPSTSIPQQVPRTNSGGRSARTAGATRGSATGADEEGDVGWDDVYDQPPGSPSMSASDAPSRSSARSAAANSRRPPTSNEPLKSINTTTSEFDSGSSSLLTDIMGALTPTQEEDKMPEDREARREWLKRRQQKRLSSNLDSGSGNSRAPDSPLNNGLNSPGLTVSPGADGGELSEREQRRQDWLKRKQTPEESVTTSSISSASGLPPMPDIPSVSSNYRLSNPSLPTEFILALDAEKSEANRLRQQLAAKDHELSKLRMEKTNELKRMSLQSLSTNNEQLNQLELSNEDLKARLMDLELDREQLKMELESAKIGLENEVKYRGIEREQAKTQMIALTSERDAALKEVAGKSVVLGSTEMIVNQTTKELAGLRNRERELTAKVADQNVQIKNQAQALVESEEKLKRAVGEVQNRSVMIRNTEERLRGLIQEMGNARAREADLVRKLQESEARLVDSSSAFEDFKKVSAENLYQAKQVEEQLRIETRDLQNQLNQVIHGSRLRDEEIKKNRDLIQGMAGRIGTMDREIGNGKAMINERDQKISAMNRDLMTAAQKEEDLLQQIQLLNQSHGGEMAQALTITQNHQRELEKIRGERDDLADKLAVSVKEAQELQEAKRSLEENIVALNNRISALDNELGVSQTLADETVIKIRQLTDDLNRASAKDRKMQEDQKQMQNRFAELDTIAQRLVADRDGWRNRSAELERLLDQSRKESGDMALMKENLERDLRQEIADGQLLLQSHIADHNQATILLRGNISNIEISLAEAKARGDELSALSTSLQGKLEASIQNEKYLTEQIQILKEARGGDMAAALDRTEKHQRELQALISERNGLQERLTELEAVLQHLVSDRDGWKSRAEGLEAELDSIAIRHTEATNLLRKTLEDSITQISNRLETVESEKAVLDARNAETIKTLQSQLHAAQVHRVGLESQIAALKKDLFEALNNDHELVVQGLNDRLDETEKTQKSLNDKISELLSTIKMKEKEKLDMQANINELEETIDELMIEQDASEKKVLKLQAAVKKAKQEVVDIERTTDASITHLRDESAFAIKRAQDEFNRTLWNVRMEMNSLVAAITQSEKEDEMDEMSGSVDVDGIFKDMRTCRQKALEWVVTINVASSESEAATQNVAVLKNQINSLNKQLGDAKREVEDFMFQLEETKELDGRQKQQIKILEQQVAKANKLKEDAEKKAISSTTESEEMVLALQQEIISIRGELSKKNEVLKRTTPAEIQEFLKSGESELAEAKNATATAEKELRAVQRMVQEKESDIAKLQEEFDGLKQQLAETRDLAQKDTDSYKSMIEGLKAQLKQERDSLSEAQEAVVNCQTMIRDLETLRNEMVMKFERQLDDKESAYVKVVTNLDAANSEIDELKYECEDLESKLQAAHTNTEALEANYQSIKDEIELLRNQRRESIEAMQSMIQSLQLRLQEEQELVEVNQTKWNEEQATHLKLVAQLETDLQEKNVHLQKLTTSSTASADEIKTLRAEIATLTVQLEDKEASFAQSLAKVTKDLETSVAEIAKLKLQLQEATAALETEKQKHEAELTALRSVVSNLESDLKLAKQQSADMSASSASAVESSSKQLADLKTKLDQVEASLAQAQKDLSESRTASADSAKEVESCKAVILELESKAKDAAEQVSKLNSEITLARELKAAGEEGGNAAVDALKKALEEQEGRLSGQVEALKKELADSVERVKVLEGQVALSEGVSKEVESVKAELARAQAEVERLKGELEKAKEAAVPAVAAASDSDTPELATAKAEVARLQEKLNESTSKAQESDKLKSELDAALADVSRLQDLIEETKSALSSEHQKDYKAIKESLDKTITERDDLKAELSVFRAHARAAADDADDDDLPPPPPIPKDVAGALSAKNSPRTSIAESVKSTKSVVSPTSSTVGRKSLTGKLYGLVGSAIGYK